VPEHNCSLENNQFPENLVNLYKSDLEKLYRCPNGTTSSPASRCLGHCII